MEYDFSGIPTDNLRVAVDNQKKGFSCNSISCGDCPFKGFKGCTTNRRFGVMFEQELYRRDHPYTAEDINKLITEEAMEEYKEITVDWTVKEIMELDFDRVEYWCGVELGFNGFAEKKEWFSNIISGLKKGYIYRYKLKPLEPARITQEMARDLRARVDNGGFKSLEEKYGRKVEIIGEEK